MLDELVDTIETLKARISEHRSILQASEAQTRLSLIDPLLCALGWDTANPAIVRPEYHLGAGRADYVLLDSNEKVLAIIEAKKLGEKLSSQHREQAIVYAHRRGVRFPILTNGSEWEVYDQSEFIANVPIEDRPLLNVSIAEVPSHRSALQLLLLWRPNLSSGNPIEATKPALGISAPAPATPAPDPTNGRKGPVQPEPGWNSLTGFDAQKGGKRPPKVRFPEEPEKDIKSWRDLLVEVAAWLVRVDALTLDNGVVTTGRRQGYCTVNFEPKNLNGNDFISNTRLSNGLYLDVNFSAPDCVSHCINLLNHCKIDPATVHVQVG